MLLGALLGWVAKRHIAVETRTVLSVAALVLASFVMPFWMLPVMMDKAEAELGVRVARDVSLALSGTATVICFSIWAPLLRHLLVLEQVGMLMRYAVWFAFAPVALCTAWDARAQQAVGQGLLAGSFLLGGAYLAYCWRSRHEVYARGGLTSRR